MKQHLDEIKKLHQAGALSEAREAYLTWLQIYPRDAEALHLLGLLSLEQDEYSQACHYLQTALVEKPLDPTITLHLTHALKAQGQYASAIELLVDVLQAHPLFVAGYNNLGVIYFCQSNWVEAERAFQAAIDLQADYLDAYYNLGLTLLKQSQRESAINTFNAILELNATHPGALFQLGKIAMEREQYVQATEFYLRLLGAYPFHLESQINLATCYLKLGRSADAMMYYLRALELAPNDLQVLFNVAVIATEQGRWQDAVSYYERALSINPDLFDAHYNLGILYWQLKQKQKALIHFHEALRVTPGQQAAQYAIHVLTGGRSIAGSPPTYIKSLFDSYAGHYDHHLSQILQYQIPRIFLEALDIKPSTSWDILDLGCGTGLCGHLFKPYARHLVGVDLSENMLERAREKQIYDDLVCSDISVYLAQHAARYDCILAGDVFVYMGDLGQVLRLCYERLQLGGQLIFNLEIGVKGDYVLTETGRFAHSRHYVERLITQCGYSLKSMQVVPLRLQNHTPVEGYLYILQRQA